MSALACDYGVLTFQSVTATDLYSYREEVFFEMTDVEKNMDTKRWPSKENIVSFSLSPSQGARGCASTNTGKFNERSSGLWSISLGMRILGTPSSSIVSVCAILSSLVDLIYIDSGHGGRDDEGDHTCACKSHFS
jgi:hypothetical protein